MSTATDQVRPLPRTAVIAAAVAALMVVAGFAMLAVVPVALTLASTLWSPRLGSLRWWAGALTALYATGLGIWILRPDPAPSLTKDLHPVLTALIVAAALAVVIRDLLRRRTLAH